MGLITRPVPTFIVELYYSDYAIAFAPQLIPYVGLVYRIRYRPTVFTYGLLNHNDFHLFIKSSHNVTNGEGC